MNQFNQPNVEELKIQASKFLKALRSGEFEKIQSAAQRLRKLTQFVSLNDYAIVKTAKLKHVLTLLAQENGYDSWAILKQKFAINSADDFVENYIGGHLNHWFSDYTEAKTYQQSSGGFLLPYKHQFFVCQSDYITRLGLNPNDPNWKAMDYDWVKPISKQAWQHMRKHWFKIKGGNKGRARNNLDT